MIVSRFAPAPTGYLHVGHVVNAIHVWGLVRAVGGQVLLRIEDHDRQRSRAEFERAILQDLEWLGFAADAPIVRQSDRAAIYEGALERLRSAGLVYACECSRRELQDAALGSADAIRGDAEQERCYPGTCRTKGARERQGVGIRVRLTDSIEAFSDLRHGPQEQRPARQCGDLLLRDRQDNWTYQFAAAVDDYAQGVTLVVRGDDLLASTGRQIQLARLLGRGTPPAYLHHALVMKSPTQKLSKADGDTSVRDLRTRGYSACDVIGIAAKLAGVSSGAAASAADAAALVARLYEAQLRELQ